MRTPNQKQTPAPRLKRLAVSGSALAVVVALGAWWQVHRSHRVGTVAELPPAGLGPGLYDVHYAFAMDFSAGNGQPRLHAESSLDGRLEVTPAKDGWLAARIDGAALKLNDTVRRIADFPKIGAEKELEKPWFLHVDNDGRLGEVRFAPGISTSARSVLMTLALGSEYVRPEKPGVREWATSESDFNGSYQPHYKLAADGSVDKEWKVETQVQHSTSAAHVRLDGERVAAADFHQEGKTLANGSDQSQPTEFAQKVKLVRTGEETTEWADGLDAADFEPFTSDRVHKEPRTLPEGNARPLAELLPLAHDEPVKVEAADHARLRNEMTLAVMKQAGAAAKVGKILREGHEPAESRRTLIEALVGAQTTESQHEVAFLLTDDEMPRAHQIQLLQGTTFARNPDPELLHALTSLAFEGKDASYGSRAAVALGGVIPRIPDAQISAPIMSTMVTQANANAIQTTPAGTPLQPTLIRIEWLDALGNTANAAALPTILQALQSDPTDLVRAAAVRALRFQDPHACLQAMDRALLKDPSITVRNGIMHAARYQGPGVLTSMVTRTLSADKSENVRLAAAYTVATWKVRSPEMASILQQALETEKSAKVRMSLRNYLKPGNVEPPTTITPYRAAP